jgi:hypothetical protein
MTVEEVMRHEEEEREALAAIRLVGEFEAAQLRHQQALLEDQERKNRDEKQRGGRGKGSRSRIPIQRGKDDHRPRKRVGPDGMVQSTKTSNESINAINSILPRH